MAAEAREREDKYDLPPGWVFPGLDGIVPDGGRATSETVRMSSTYYDTADRDLLRHGLTLRRRSGERDAGWQLKVPEDGARTEIRLPADAGRGVPKELRDLVAGVRMGAPLRVLARLDTERIVHSIVDAAGTVLAEIVEDHVVATTPGTDAAREWDEVEVELVDGDESVLARARRVLTRAGAKPAKVGSKLVRALGPQDVVPARPNNLAGTVQTYLDEQYDAIVRGDLDLRRQRDVVHTTRVAIRRYRSVLRIFPIFGPRQAETLDAELSWYAGVLGEVRDRQVLRTHLDGLVGELPDGVARAALAARIDAALDAEEAEARRVLARAMAGSRYPSLLRTLRAWRDDPPLTSAADKPRKAVATHANAALRTVEKRLAKAHGKRGTDLDLHRARKAAKRARYAFELAQPVLGKSAAAQVKALKKRQDELGLHQDSVVAAEFLQRLAARPAGDATDFALGALWIREQDRINETR